MLKINFPILDTPIAIKGATVLSIDDTIVFSNLIRDFYNFDDQDSLKIFDDNLKDLKVSELTVITDILGFNVNSPAILKLIYSDLESQLNEKLEVKSKIESMLNRLTELIGFECLENELDLELDNISVSELFKALGVRIETKSDTIYEKCYEILQVQQYLPKKRLLVFVNISAYLTAQEINRLIEYIELAQLDVLFVEPSAVGGMKGYHLDNDFFLMKND